MKKTVLTFGLISGLMISILMGGSLLLADKIGSGHSMALGYTIMLASFLLIYFGIRSYRDNTLAGQISFGRAFACGILITLITTVCYVAMWEVLYFNFMPHFMDSYFAAQIHKVQSSGLDLATTAAQVAARQRSQQLYRSYRDNTLAGQISFGRAFACGILITLITTVCYVAMWEVLYFNFMPHFMDSYFAAQIHKVQSAGLDPATTAAQVAAIQRSQQLYQNPFVNMAYTFIEPLPVGLIITVLSAAMLRRKAPVEPTAARAVVTT